MRPSERSTYKFWYLGDHQGLQVYLLIKGNFIIHLYLKTFSEVLFFNWSSLARIRPQNVRKQRECVDFKPICLDNSQFEISFFNIVSSTLFSLVGLTIHAQRLFWVNGILCFSRKQNLNFLFFYVIVCFFYRNAECQDLVNERCLQVY